MREMVDNLHRKKELENELLNIFVEIMEENRIFKSDPELIP